MDQLAKILARLVNPMALPLVVGGKNNPENYLLILLVSHQKNRQILNKRNMKTSLRQVDWRSMP